MDVTRSGHLDYSARAVWRNIADFLWTFKDTVRSGSYLSHDINGSGQRVYPQISGCILDVPKLLHSVVQHEGE